MPEIDGMEAIIPHYSTTTKFDASGALYICLQKTVHKVLKTFLYTRILVLAGAYLNKKIGG